MRHLFVRGVVALAFAVPLAAYAAEMPVKGKKAPPPPPPPPPPVVYNWSGCYVGGYVGSAWNGRVATTDRGNGSIAYNDGIGNQWSYKLGSHVTGGGTAGCNWDVGSSLVAGVEAEAGYLRLKGSASNPLSPGRDLIASSQIGDWDAVVAARAGYAADRVLIYAKGGAAFFKSSSTSADTCETGPCGLGLINATGHKSQATWAIGGGLEYAVGSNWTIKGEYLHFGRGEDYRACGSQTSAAGAGFGTTFCWNEHSRGIDTAKVGLNYKLN
jgi:outer membrane immunogenic protein